MNKVIQYDGAAIHYTVRGEGKPVVYLHGFAEDRTVWDDISENLKDRCRLIIPDLPGTGDSQLLKQENSLEAFAKCIKEILKQEQVSSCVMIGHSMGGYVTLAFADQYPEMLVALGLFHSSAYADDEEKKATRRKAIEFIKENGAEAFLKTSIPGLFKDTERSHDVIQSQLTKGKEFTPEALIAHYQAMISRPDRTHILKELAIPFLFIMGEHDKAVPFQHSLEQSHLPAHSYVYKLKESAHMGMFEEKEESIKILANFLQDVY